MTRLLGIAGIYVLMFLGWTGVGAFLFFAPVRAGNLIHESFGLFPQVHRTDRALKLLLRIAGLALLAFAARFALRIADLSGGTSL